MTEELDEWKLNKMLVLVTFNNNHVNKLVNNCSLPWVGVNLWGVPVLNTHSSLAQTSGENVNLNIPCITVSEESLVSYRNDLYYAVLWWFNRNYDYCMIVLSYDTL